jgi:ankyrin repeat protein
MVILIQFRELDDGANIDSHDEKGWTPLMHSAREGHQDIVEDLVVAGANVDLQNEWDDTALIKAARGGHLGIVEVLVAAGADVNVHGTYG